MDMKTLRTNKWLVTVAALCWLTATTVAFGQATITRVPDLGGGTFGMDVRALNNAGAVAGYSRDTNDNELAFLFSNGVLRNLGTLGGAFSAAADLSDNGLITGYALLPEDEFGSSPQHAFLYSGTSMIDLGALPGGSYSEGLFVNANGDVAGAADANGFFGAGFVYRNGHMTNIGSFGSGMSFIQDLNANGQVVGYSVDETFLVTRAFFYDTNLVDLGTLGGVYSSAWAINDAGVIVGDADKDDGTTRAEGAFTVSELAVSPPAP